MTKHPAVQFNGGVGVFALGVASDHRVPGENVGGLDLGEDAASVGHVGGGGQGYEGEDEVLAHVRMRRGNALAEGEGVDLLQLELGGSAGMQEGDALSENVS